MSTRRILYLSYDGLTDPLGQSQILPYLVGLSKQSYSFTVISFEKKEAFTRSHKEVEAQCTLYQIDWVPLRYHKYPPVFSTIYDLFRLQRVAVRNHLTKKFQIVHCRSYISSLVGLHFKRKWNVKFIFDMRGFWADERVEGGLWNLRNPIYRLIYQFFKSKEKQFLTESDHTISLTHNAKSEVESWGIKLSPITVIPTCVDLDLFDPSKIEKNDQKELRARVGINESDFILLYLGSWGTWYLTKEMLNFFSSVKASRSNAKFLILTGDKIDLGNFPFKRDTIVTSVPRHLVPLYLSLASLSVCFIKPSFSKKASSATKIGELMAMNISVVTNEGWGDVKALHDLPGVFLYKEALSGCESNTLNSSFLRTYCEKNLSLGVALERYSEVYSDLSQDN